MTATGIDPETRGKAHHTSYHPEEGRIAEDMNSKTEPWSETSDSDARVSSPGPQQDQQDGTKKHSHAHSSGPQVYPPPKKEYGYQWNWDQEAKDYIQIIDGVTVRYRDYQRAGGIPPTTIPSSSSSPPSSSQVKPGDELVQPSSSSDLPAESSSAASAEKEDEEYVHVDLDPEIAHEKRGSISSQSSRQSAVIPKPPKLLKEYAQPLDDGFKIVDKPKRFFQIGRVFATVWFEPGGKDPPGRRADLEWTRDCPKYHDEKPIAKFRWFIVVRKRLHHSLCFNITTIGPKGPRKADRGRGVDFVVLHNSNVEPSKPFEVEGITRDPIAVIIEAGEESISPWARLDCGRIYTVEDNLRVRKIGRVHTASLSSLETYFKESVL